MPAPDSFEGDKLIFAQSMEMVWDGEVVYAISPAAVHVLINRLP